MNDDNIISILDKIQRKLEDTEAEFSDEDTAWETMVDLSLQDLSEYIQGLIACNKELITEVEDLSRDVQDLKNTTQKLIRLIYTERRPK